MPVPKTKVTVRNDLIDQVTTREFAQPRDQVLLQVLEMVAHNEREDSPYASLCAHARRDGSVLVHIFSPANCAFLDEECSRVAKHLHRLDHLFESDDEEGTS